MSQILKEQQKEASEHHSGAAKEPVKTMRVPICRVEELKRLIQSPDAEKIPLFGCRVRAGFPSPADDYIEDFLDLNEHLIKNPAATFMVRAQGDSMTGASINSGDILVVDRSVEAVHGKVVIAAVDGELTVKRLYRKEGVVKLLPENPSYPEINITKEMDSVIWGVVTNVIHEIG